MRRGFYFRLARTNIKRNKEVFKPYMFASALMVFVYYVFLMLNNNAAMVGFENFTTFTFVMSIGVYVAMAFSVIFIFYANSFIMKRRKKELGLYGILGLEKRHIGVLMACETVITGAVSIVSGIIFGLVFSKLAVIIAAKLIHSYSHIDVAFDGSALMQTAGFFIFIFFIVLIYNLFQVSVSRPIDLLKSANKGEAEPKGSLVMTVFGVLLLAAGYIGAQVMRGSGLIFVMAAPTVAVVIIGTYLLFMAGSIFVLRQLKKRRNIYYKPDNFISISGLMYRMKQNAVGLASICILCTMVIITLSTTFCLWFGIEDSLKKTFSDDVEVLTMPREYKDTLEAAVDKYSKQYDVSKDEFWILKDRAFQGNIDAEGHLKSAWKASEDGNGYSLDNYLDIKIISADEYEQVTGQKVFVKPGEGIFIFNRERLELLDDEYSSVAHEDLNHISEGMTLHIQDEGNGMWHDGVGERTDSIDEKLYITEVRSEDKMLEGKYNVREGIYLVVADEATADACSNGVRMSGERYMAVMNYSGSEADKDSFIHGVEADLYATGYGAYMFSMDLNKTRYYGAYGGLLFVGVLLSVLFLMAMVIIIYYKQMSEGFEDRDRYHILMQVGIDEQDVKKTINKQVRTIFMVPLLVAVIHTAAAFRMMGFLVAMADVSGIENYTLFGLCTMVITGIVTIIYTVVYKITAKAYYRFIH